MQFCRQISRADNQDFFHQLPASDQVPQQRPQDDRQKGNQQPGGERDIDSRDQARKYVEQQRGCQKPQDDRLHEVDPELR